VPRGIPISAAPINADAMRLTLHRSYTTLQVLVAPRF
jgi:hypothetical protein